MAEAVAVVLPKESVSDDSYLLVEILVQSGASVVQGEVIARCETSKATLDIASPCGGFVHHHYSQGQEIPVGGILALVSETPAPPAGMAATLSAPAPASAAPPATPDSRASTAYADESEGGPRQRATPLARKMMSEFHLENGDFPGLHRVTRADVMERVESMPRDPVPTRFSKAAKEWISRQSVPESAFENAGLVTLAEARRRIEGVEKTGSAALAPAAGAHQPAPSRDAKAAAPASGIRAEAAPENADRIPLNKAKRAEIQSLQDGQDGVLASAITVLVSAEGAFAADGSAAHPMLLSIVLYEAGRLLRKYPELNGFYQDGHSVQYRDVHAGIAFEIDQGLKVPVLRHTDTLALDAVKSSIDDFIGKYLEKRLGLEELTGATFTVTDLSNDKVFSFLPLINRRQAAILGIGGVQAFSDQGRMYPLTLAFDHRVSTGRRASQFLGELKGRLESFSSPLAAGGEPKAQRRCRQCLRAEGELQKKQFLLMAVLNGRADYLCTTCAKGW